MGVEITTKSEKLMAEVTERSLRNALGLFPTGIVIVATIDENGEQLGMTINSFNSVSLSPPLILFSIGHSAYSLDSWRQAENYSINILAEDQTDVSSLFARALADKWSDVSVETGATGVPLIANALAKIECERYARYDGGDHDIFVGRVVAIHEAQRTMCRPAVFFQGKYRRLDLEVTFPTPHDEAALLHGW